MSIDKMRPIDLHNKALLLREKSGVEFYINECENFVEIDCPICGSSKINSKFEFFKYGFSHKTCQNCNSLYVPPRPTQDDLFKYYTDCRNK